MAKSRVEPRLEKTYKLHVRTTKAQVSLRIRALGLAPLLAAAHAWIVCLLRRLYAKSYVSEGV